MEKARNVEEQTKENLFTNSGQQEKLPDDFYNKADSFCKKARRPLANYLLIVGIPQGAPSPFLNAYNKFMILVLVAACIRRWSQISRAPGTPYISMQETVFDPNVILTFCRFTFVFGGLVTLSSLQAIDCRRRRFMEAVDVAIDPDNIPLFGGKLRKVICYLLLFSVSMILIGCFFEYSFRTKLFGISAPWAQPLIGVSLLYIPIELYLLIICETSITMLSVDFCVSCTILRYLVVDVCIHMRKNFKDSPTLVKLHHLDEIQSHHFGLITAKKCLEDCYAFAVFLFYSIAVPCCCIMAYIAYRNNDNHTVVMSSMLMWITSIVIRLLILSIPAFQLVEEGEDLLTCAFEMYQRCLKGEDDARITTQFAILTNQIQSHPMIISAYNYFPMNRAMLLSVSFSLLTVVLQMFSVIFTYFLILVQFSEEGKEIQSVLDLLKNGTNYNEMDKLRRLEESTEESYLSISTVHDRTSVSRYLSAADSFCRKARHPLVNYLVFVGITDNDACRSIRIYRKFLVIVSIRKATQISRAPDTPYISIQETIFDPNVILTFCRFTFVFAALVALLSLQAIAGRRRQFMEAVDAAIDPENVPVFIQKLRKAIYFLIFFAVFMKVLGCLTEIFYRTGVFGTNIPWVPPLIGSSLLYLPIELYLIIACQTSVTMAAGDFFVSCTILRYLVVDVCIHLRKNFKDSPTLVKLHHLDEIQSHHFGLIIAKKHLEDCYAFTLFLFYSIAVPSCCFMAYIAYRNSDNNTAISSTLIIWITSTIILLLILSIPAFQLVEEGEDLLTCAFEMYQRCLKGEDDARITTQFAILTNQIQSHPMIISAYNYFPMNRAMLLSMFSVIFTYFLILVQFSEEGKEIQSVLETLKNVSMTK